MRFESRGAWILRTVTDSSIAQPQPTITLPFSPEYIISNLRLQCTFQWYQWFARNLNVCMRTKSSPPRKAVFLFLQLIFDYELSFEVIGEHRRVHFFFAVSMLSLKRIYFTSLSIYLKVHIFSSPNQAKSSYRRPNVQFRHLSKSLLNLTRN